MQLVYSLSIWVAIEESLSNVILNGAKRTPFRRFFKPEDRPFAPLRVTYGGPVHSHSTLTKHHYCHSEDPVALRRETNAEGIPSGESFSWRESEGTNGSVDPSLLSG
jgi:hypothetical protein